MLAKNLLETAGNASEPSYIEDVFSTYLFTGNGTTQTVTNGINLTGKGGMVWRKQRDAAANHFLADTVRGTYSTLSSNTTAAASGSSYIDFLSDGFQAVNSSSSNPSGALQVSWTFREQPKFFDVVTYTGTGVAGVRSFAHSLASVPGFIIIKDCTNTNPWIIYHRSITAGSNMEFTTGTTYANGYFSTAPTSSVFSVDSTASTATTNVNGATYVAYLFAHNAGGFGATGTDNVISCGSFTTDGSANATVNLGYEPQWLLFRRTDSSGQNWNMLDTSRAWVATASSSEQLVANSSAAGVTTANFGAPTATGFTITGVGPSANYIYIAIRRGPMKVPTDGTKVFSSIARTGTGAAATVTGVGFAPDLVGIGKRGGTGNYGPSFFDRLRGAKQDLISSGTAAEATFAESVTSFNMDGITLGTDNTNDGFNYTAGSTYINHFFKRAPGFFDEVCYTGNGAGSGSFAITHNLGAVPELIIFRQRNGTSNWQAATNFTSTNWRSMFLNFTNAGASQTTYATNDWFAAQPTATAFTVGFPYYSTGNYVAYLFASCPGVSKVGSYTGNGATQTINCGFTGGARFVLIKRTDSTGGWYVYDTARGMTVLTDPYLLLNSTAAETATLGSVITSTGGFTVNAAILAEINTNAASYIFLAIA